MENLFNSIYKDRVVLVTGHTGFKGSWLVYWLTQMGAKVIGYSLEAPTNPNHIELLKLDIVSVIGDIRDQEWNQILYAIHNHLYKETIGLKDSNKEQQLEESKNDVEQLQLCEVE